MAYCFSHVGLKPFIVNGGTNLLDFQDQWGVPNLGNADTQPAPGQGLPGLYNYNSPWNYTTFKGIAQQSPNPPIHQYERMFPTGSWVDQGAYLIDKVWQQNGFQSLTGSALPPPILPNGNVISPTLSTDYYCGWPMQVKSWFRHMIRRRMALYWGANWGHVVGSSPIPDDLNTFLDEWENGPAFRWGTSDSYYSNRGKQYFHGHGPSTMMNSYFPFQPMTSVNFGRTVFMTASAGYTWLTGGTSPTWGDISQFNSIFQFVGNTYARLARSVSNAFGTEITDESLGVTISATASGRTKHTLRQIHGFLPGTTITSKFVAATSDISGIFQSTGGEDAVMYYTTCWEKRFQPGGFQDIYNDAIELGPVADGIVTWTLTNEVLDKQPNQETGGELCFFTSPRYGSEPNMVDGSPYGLTSWGGWSIGRANQKETRAECDGPHCYPVGGTRPVGGFGDGGGVLGRLNAPYLLWS